MLLGLFFRRSNSTPSLHDPIGAPASHHGHASTRRRREVRCFPNVLPLGEKTHRQAKPRAEQGPILTTNSPPSIHHPPHFRDAPDIIACIMRLTIAKSVGFRYHSPRNRWCATSGEPVANCISTSGLSPDALSPVPVTAASMGAVHDLCAKIESHNLASSAFPQHTLSPSPLRDQRASRVISFLTPPTAKVISLTHFVRPFQGSRIHVTGKHSRPDVLDMTRCCRTINELCSERHRHPLSLTVSNDRKQTSRGRCPLCTLHWYASCLALLHPPHFISFIRSYTDMFIHLQV